MNDVVDFLKQTLPFSHLSEQQIIEFSNTINIGYVRQQHPPQLNNQRIAIIRKGAIDLTTQEGQWVDRLAEGECVGISSYFDAKHNIDVLTCEDCILFYVSYADFERLCKQAIQIEQYFNQVSSNRFHKLSIGQKNDQHQNLASSIDIICQNDVHWVDGNTSIQAAATLMADQNISSLPICDSQQSITGIITDRDLRQKVVARAIPVNEPVHKVMTEQPITIDLQTSIHQAWLIMNEANIHHLPVVNENKLWAMLSASDIDRYLLNRPFTHSKRLRQANTIKQLIDIHSETLALYFGFASDESLFAGQWLSQQQDILTQKAIALHQNQLLLESFERPLTKWAWLVFGSSARQELTPSSDQDNGYIFATPPSEKEMLFFNELAKRVCQTLDQCGYVFCPGDVMATNKKLQKSQEQWLLLFKQWTEKPVPEAILNSSILFDIRTVFGDKSLIDPLINQIKQLNQPIFMAYLIKSALTNKPPLGFFRDFLLEQDQKHKNQLDLKKSSISIIVELARIFDLQQNQQHAWQYDSNVQKRLNQKISLSDDLSQSLSQAWQYLNQLRFENQKQQWQNQKDKFTAYFDPQGLSSLERQQLKGIFKLIGQIQAHLARQVGS